MFSLWPLLCTEVIRNVLSLTSVVYGGYKCSLFNLCCVRRVQDEELIFLVYPGKIPGRKIFSYYIQWSAYISIQKWWYNTISVPGLEIHRYMLCSSLVTDIICKYILAFVLYNYFSYRYYIEIYASFCLVSFF